VGRELVPTAWSSDGLIEAVGIPTAALVIGVQWHPGVGMERRPLSAGLIQPVIDVPKNLCVKPMKT